MENSVFEIWFEMKSIAIEGKCFFCSQNNFREHWHTINSSLFINILFYNKGMGCQRLPIGLSSIIYWAKKNQNCRQPKLDSSSGQIYWVISYHRYISRSRYAGEGENYRLKGTARCWRLAQQMLISWTKQQHHWFKKDKWKRKKIQIWWFVGITVPEVLMMPKYTFNSPNKNTLFNILPHKIK